MKQERIIYEEQPFYSLERVPKPRENALGTRYLVKLAVVGAVDTTCMYIVGGAHLLNLISLVLRTGLVVLCGQPLPVQAMGRAGLPLLAP